MSALRGRVLDHVVMPFASLGEARQVFEVLGFTVAPDAAHPFGSGNACIFLEDGSYIEPLALLDRELAETQAAEGNAFLRHDLAYRLRHGLPGLTGLALKTADATGDDGRFRGAGFDGGSPLEFGRPLHGEDGAVTELRFRLAFAADRQFPAFFLFACQRLFDMALDRGALTRHPNGVRALSRLVFAAREPEAICPFLETVLEPRDVVANSFGFSLTFGERALDVLGPEGLAARYGLAHTSDDAARFLGLVLATSDAAQMEKRAEAASLPAHETLGRVIVPLTAEGIFLGFEQTA